MQGLGLRSLAGNSMATLFRQLASAVIQLGTVVIVARLFGPDGNGTYAIAVLVPTLLATFLNLGLAPANVYHLGGKKINVALAWKTSLKAAFLISPAGLIIGGLAIILLGETFFQGVDKRFLWLSLASFPLLLLIAFMSSIFQGIGEFRRFNTLMLLQPTLTLILILLGLGCGWVSLIYIISAYTTAAMLSFFWGLYLLHGLLKKEPLDTHQCGESYIKKAFLYGYKAHLSNILTFLNYRLDMFLVNAFLGPASTGVYLIAVQLSERMWLLSQSVSTVLLPKLSELSDLDERKRQLTGIVARWMFVVAFFASAFLAAIAFPLINILFGSQYVEAVVTLMLLLPGVVFGSALKVLANDIAARGRPGLNMVTSLVVVAVNVALNVILIPLMGIEGAAISTSAAYFVSFMLCLVIQARISRVSVLATVTPNQDDIRIIKWTFESIRRKVRG